MAEAACGPSNALSTFKQHTSVDRSLQQDRLHRRHVNSPQNFRSANPNTAHLDADFDAFQSGFAPPILDNPLHHQLQHATPSQQAPSWATDFQHLNISSPSAPTSDWAQGFQQHIAPTPDWAQGFQQHIAQSAPRAQTTVQSPLAFQQQARYGLSGFQSSFTPQQSHFGAGLQSKGKQPVQAEQYDEAAFERAFDMAREDMMADVEQEQPMMQEDKDLEAMIERVEAATQQEATNMLNDVAQEAEQERDWRLEDTIHGSDVEFRPFDHVQEDVLQEDQQQRPTQDDDALAATAQELLEKVSHDQSDKFKNSQFLSLMRKLADREVRVEGDKMVDVSPTSTIVTSSSSSSSSPPPPHPITIPSTRDNNNDHEFDHWESPYT